MPSKGRRRTRFLRTCISRVWPTISKVLFSCATISLDRARSFLSRVRDSEPWARRSCQRLKAYSYYCKRPQHIPKQKRFSPRPSHRRPRRLAGSRGVATRARRPATPDEISDRHPRPSSASGGPARPGHLSNTRPSQDIDQDRVFEYFFCHILVNIHMFADRFETNVFGETVKKSDYHRDADGSILWCE